MEFCEKSKVVSFFFSIIKNIVAPPSLSSLPMKLICCFKLGFCNSICLLKSIAITLQCFEKYNLINYMLYNHYFCSFQLFVLMLALYLL